jgi:hypothetical protein
MHSLSVFLRLAAVWAAVCGAAAARGGDVLPKAVDGKITWLHNYDEAKKLANQVGKPLFVVFRCER